MNRRLEYRGDLAETTLPEMLYTIERFRVPGIVEARAGEVVKRVYIRDGYLIHASSTDLADSLGAHLKRHERISPRQLDEITRQRQSSNKRFGVLLVERGLLSPAEVLTALREQIEGIVWSLFYWQQGQVTFGLGELKDEEMVQIRLPIRQVIVEGIKRAPDAKQLVARIGRRETVLEPCYRVEDLIETGMDGEDLALLRLVDGGKTLYDLCSQGPRPPAENAKILYALKVLHLIRPRHPERQTTGPVKIRLRTSGDRFPK